MSAILQRNIQIPSKASSRLQVNQISIRSLITSDRALKSKLQASFMMDQQNTKELQRIQKNVKQLRQKQKKERSYLKRLKKIYEQQLKEFQHLKAVTAQALQQKNSEIQLLGMENTQLKQENIELCTVISERQMLDLKIQNLESENQRLSQQLVFSRQNLQRINAQFQQQSDFLDSGIRKNQISTEPQANTNVPESLRQVENLSWYMQNDRKSENSLKNEQARKIQTQQINKCNSMIQSLLKQISKTQKKTQNEGASNEGAQNEGAYIEKGNSFLSGLTDQPMRKTEQLSKALNDAFTLQREVKSKDLQIKNLTVRLQDLQRQSALRLQDIGGLKQQIQIHQDLQRMKDQTERQRRCKKNKNFLILEQKLIQLFEDKTLKEHSSVYETFTNAAKQIFISFNRESNDTNDVFIDNVVRIVESNIIKLNHYLKQKAERDILRIQKMVGFMKNANQIVEKGQNQYDLEKDDFDMSSPQRFNPALIAHHRRQQSQSSAHSFKKSIVLQEDLDNAINFSEQIDQIKEEMLEKQISDLNNSQVEAGGLDDGKNSEQQNTVQDVLSQSSFAKSKAPSMTHSQSTNHYNKNVKNSKIKAKLKKKRKD